MKEAVFIRQNIAKWQNYEREFFNIKELTPDYLAEAYGELTSDLAFAQTHYAGSSIIPYLNGLTSRLHNEVYGNKRENMARVVTFWTQEVPRAVWDGRKELLLSLVIFLASVLVGVVSELADIDFARIMMGDDYVDMTINNIHAGNPVAVYAQDSDAMTMFLGIFFNNVKVAFYAFAAGILTSIFTGMVLMLNGVMFGSFAAFFYRYGVLGTAMATVMLHGTIELSVVVVAGGAGIILGNGWLFPGTYSRLESLKLSAKRGMKVAVGTVPLFFLAAFIEGFLSRHAEWPMAVKLTIIGFSALLILFYYVFYPWSLHRNEETR